MKNFLLGVIFTLVILTLAVLGYIRFGFAEVQSDIPPSGFENSLLRAGVHASLRREAPNVPNPVPPTDANLIAGGKFYLNACAGCHGTPGKPFGNHGPILFPPIPELPVVGTDLTESQIFWAAKHGIRRSGMFANGVWAKDQDLWMVAAYIKRMNSLSPAVRDGIDKSASSQK
ncbi:MAG TPA: cytochrome c [Candidatus Acidoferrales bacterium]|nr:cytochrome c [Candidatus Acidoferrales bacterium]